MLVATAGGLAQEDPPGSTTTATPDSTTTTMPDSTTTVPGDGGEQPPTSGPPSDVSPTGPEGMTPVVEGDLRRTGSNMVPLATGALALIALGVGLVAARRLRLHMEG